VKQAVSCGYSGLPVQSVLTALLYLPHSPRYLNPQAHFSSLLWTLGTEASQESNVLSVSSPALDQVSFDLGQPVFVVSESSGQSMLFCDLNGLGFKNTHTAERCHREPYKYPGLLGEGENPIPTIEYGDSSKQAVVLTLHSSRG
jgi:hypothetical protein